MPFEGVASDRTGMTRRQRKRDAFLRTNRRSVFNVVH